MTIGTLDLQVRAVQRERRVDRMIEGRDRPAARGVTVAAGGSIEAVMLVVSSVAGDALPCRTVLESARLMAVSAGNVLMPAGQREARLQGMIEQDLAPAPHSMAIGAVIPVQSLVRVVVHVTGITVGGCIDIRIVAMAARALQPFVAAEQRIAGALFVLELRVLPPGSCMTVGAILAQAASMVVVLLMTCITELRRLPVLCARRMTVFTLR